MVVIALATLSLLALGTAGSATHRRAGQSSVLDPSAHSALARRVCSGPGGSYPCFGSVGYKEFQQTHLARSGATQNESDVECLYIPNKTMPRDCKEARALAEEHWVADGTFLVHKDECVYAAYNTCRFSICALEKDRPPAPADDLMKMSRCEDKCSMQGCRWNGNVMLTLTHDL